MRRLDSPRPPVTELPEAREVARVRPPSATGLATVAVVVAVLVASGIVSEVSPGALMRGVPNVVDFVSRMFPPDPSVLGTAVGLMGETLAIAVVGTALGLVGAVPLGVLGARNLFPERVAHRSVRLVVNGARAIPELMWALLFVSAVGLGPLAGTLAIAIGSAAGMGRLFADIFESADLRAWHAARSAGAGRLQRISWVLLPESLPVLSSYTLLVLDGNVRAASLLGLVGAGGIGMELTQRLRLFDYGAVMTIVLVVLVVVMALDTVSGRIRRRLV